VIFEVGPNISSLNGWVPMGIFGIFHYYMKETPLQLNSKNILC
jgi:hypothetical protein